MTSNNMPLRRGTHRETLWMNLKKYPWLYAISVPVILFYIVYCYLPMYGIIIAFFDYVPARGILGSKWVGLKHFSDFITNRNFSRVVGNTLSINLQLLVFGFPLPVLFALMLNEIRSVRFRRLTQTVTYLPHFVSSMVVCGLLASFTKADGLITNIFGLFGAPNTNLLSIPGWFQPLYILMRIWQEFGWDSIIYFAALTALDPALYEAARIDGASRWKQALHVTLPGLAPTITMLLILRIGSMMSLGWDRIVLLYTPLVYSKADVISSYVYRTGLTKMQYSYATAIGLFNSLINVILLIGANTISRKVNDSALW